MDTDRDDDVLHNLAEGHDMDYSQWPGLLSRLIPRLEKIVRDDFPTPTLPRPQPILASSQPIPSSPPLPASQEQPSLVADTSSQNSTESTNKENALPPSAPAATQGLLASFPPHILSLLDSITKTLQTLFSKYPPHTIQRFAELILRPRQHYKSLYPYLHAVDRVVHVTSGAHVFPLPPAIPDPSAASVLSNGASTTDPRSISWGNPTSTAQATLGSDESLGGALLTPILWLNKNGSNHVSDMEGEVRTESTETIEGPNGPGGIETVSVSVNGISSATAASTTLNNPLDTGNTDLRMEGGVTQGELLRQEQRAGVVPAAQLAGHNRGDADGTGEEDETPHARGPEEIGMEDMGPQATSSTTERNGPGMTMQGIDVEAAVGRRAEESEVAEDEIKEDEAPRTPKREADEDLGADEKRIKEDPEEESKKLEEEMNVEMVDADGKTEDENKVGNNGESIGSDAIDTSTV